MELTPFIPRQLSVFDIPEKAHEHNEKLSEAIIKLKERF
jgi:hypothetical protein